MACPAMRLATSTAGLQIGPMGKRHLALALKVHRELLPTISMGRQPAPCLKPLAF